MAKKSKAGAIASGKAAKPKAAEKPVAAKAKRPARQKKAVVEKIEPGAALKHAVGFDPTNDQIQMRAYFISERRRRFDLPGDANSDWLEAKRQLLAETRH
ncbi:MAG TPA: hypothetical protein VKS98_06165 [Chthoniobacterales bacterium]|nr:hypothetical protein [Chthoniobacterales bacterium]